MDIWVRRYCVDGTLRWTTQFGTVAEERIGGYGGQLGIDTIDGAVYIGGSTQGAFYGADAEGACDGGLSGADCPYYSGGYPRHDPDGLVAKSTRCFRPHRPLYNVPAMCGTAYALHYFFF